MEDSSAIPTTDPAEEEAEAFSDETIIMTGEEEIQGFSGTTKITGITGTTTAATEGDFSGEEMIGETTLRNGEVAAAVDFSTEETKTTDKEAGDFSAIMAGTMTEVETEGEEGFLVITTTADHPTPGASKAGVDSSVTTPEEIGTVEETLDFSTIMEIIQQAAEEVVADFSATTRATIEQAVAVASSIKTQAAAVEAEVFSAKIQTAAEGEADSSRIMQITKIMEHLEDFLTRTRLMGTTTAVIPGTTCPILRCSTTTPKICC